MTTSLKQVDIVTGQHILTLSSVQSLSRVWLFATPWIAAHQASLFITISRSSLRLISIESVMPSSHLILGRPLLLLPPIPPSSRVFSNEPLFTWGGQSTGVSALALFLPKKSQGWSPSQWTGWISLQSKGLSRVFSTVQKHQILWHSAFFRVQLSHPYMTTGKTIALTRWTLVGKVMSLLLNMLSRLVITFLPRSKRLLISWLQAPSAVILEPCEPLIDHFRLLFIDGKMKLISFSRVKFNICCFFSSLFFKLIPILLEYSWLTMLL